MRAILLVALLVACDPEVIELAPRGDLAITVEDLATPDLATCASCLAAGAACVVPAECCSFRCEPVPGSAARVCLSPCKPDGEPCVRALDCCSLGCFRSVCGGGLCRVEGDSCSVSSECCSHACAMQKCRFDSVAACRPTGERCAAPGECCGRACEGGRCGFGSSPDGGACGQ